MGVVGMDRTMRIVGALGLGDRRQTWKREEISMDDWLSMIIFSFVDDTYISIHSLMSKHTSFKSYCLISFVSCFHSVFCIVLGFRSCEKLPLPVLLKHSSDTILVYTVSADDLLRLIV